jgi:hypothetical protein
MNTKNLENSSRGQHKVVGAVDSQTFVWLYGTDPKMDQSLSGSSGRKAESGRPPMPQDHTTPAHSRGIKEGAFDAIVWVDDTAAEPAPQLGHITWRQGLPQTTFDALEKSVPSLRVVGRN